MTVIHPIRFIDLGECPNCNHCNLYIIQRDVTVTLINREGVISDVIETKTEGKLFCANCKTEFEYEKHGFIIKPMLRKYEELKRIQKEEMYKQNTKNPFGK